MFILEKSYEFFFLKFLDNLDMIMNQINFKIQIKIIADFPEKSYLNKINETSKGSYSDPP